MLRVCHLIPRRDTSSLFSFVATAATIGSALLLAAIGLGCSQRLIAAQNEQTLLPSELAANPEKYDGKHVKVRGYIVLGPEARNIADFDEGYNDRHGACLGLDGPESMFTGVSRHYTQKISGIFRRKLCRDNDVCLNWCNSSGIELDKGSKP
jgi:hypothetical protein